jgi:hypothetical protein
VAGHQDFFDGPEQAAETVCAIDTRRPNVAGSSLVASSACIRARTVKYPGYDDAFFDFADRRNSYLCSARELLLAHTCLATVGAGLLDDTYPVLQRPGSQVPSLHQPGGQNDTDPGWPRHLESSLAGAEPPGTDGDPRAARWNSTRAAGMRSCSQASRASARASAAVGQLGSRARGHSRA